MVHIDGRDRARRHAVTRGEQSKSAVAVARNPPIETNPDITGVILTERVRKVVLCRKARRLRHIAKGLAVALPQQEVASRKGGDPNITVRISKQSVRAACARRILVRIEGKWSRSLDLIEIIRGRKTTDT